MKASVFQNTLNALRRRQPFKPFTVVLVNGDRIEVDHQDAMVVRDGVAIYVGPGGVPVIFDNKGVAEQVGDVKGESTE